MSTYHDPATTEVIVKFIHETSRAILVEYDGREIWIPKSQLVNYASPKRGELVELSISEWFAEQKDLY